MKEIDPIFQDLTLIQRCLKTVYMEWHKTVMSLSTNLYGTSAQKTYFTSKNIVKLKRTLQL